jgi:hypothetical protein
MADEGTEAVRHAGDQDQLLEGEQADTHVASDAAHWIDTRPVKRA